MALVDWIHRNYPDVIFTSALGGIKASSIGMAVKMKRLGYRRGWPDLFFPEPRPRPCLNGENGKAGHCSPREGHCSSACHCHFRGLFIELKAKGGRANPDQSKMIKDLRARGYEAVICELEEAKNVIRFYFNKGRENYEGWNLLCGK